MEEIECKVSVGGGQRWRRLSLRAVCEEGGQRCVRSVYVESREHILGTC